MTTFHLLLLTAGIIRFEVPEGALLTFSFQGELLWGNKCV